MSSLVFMFPGQTSRYPEMIEKLTAYDAHCSDILEKGSDILGRDLVQHYRAANPAIFARNRDVQLGVFLASHMYLKLLERTGVRSDWSLGLSLGEYNHLVHIGALSFEDALLLLEQRGQLYEAGPAGVMVSVFPVDAGAVEEKIHERGLGGRVVIGLYNSPRQQVLSGQSAAVKELVAALEDDTLIEAVETEPLIPMHAPTFAPVAEKFRCVLDRTTFVTPTLSYIPNVGGEPISGATPDQIRTHLTDHVCKAVRWQASIESLAARLPDPHFIEVGPRSILYNLFGRGWMPGQRSRTDVADNWPDHIQELTANLRHGA
jgi:[acyl-carrier-protein] S-malonyltransferase